MSVKNVTMWFFSRNVNEKMKKFLERSCSSRKVNHQFPSHSEAIGTMRCKTIHITEEYNNTCCA